MESGNSSFRALIPPELEQQIHQWDGISRLTFINTPQRDSLAGKLNEQWQTRNRFISTHPEQAPHQNPETDKFTISVWMLQLLSTEAPEGSLESYERSCDELRELAIVALADARGALLRATSKLKNMLSLLQALSDKEIALTDTRFTPTTRYENQRARTSFRYSPLYDKLGQAIESASLIEGALNPKKQDPEEELDQGNLQEWSRVIQNYIADLEKSNQSQAPIILLGGGISVADFSDRIAKFSDAVKASQEHPITQRCNEEKARLEKLKCAQGARDICLRTVDDIIFQCDNSYRSQLYEFVKSNNG